MTTPQQSFDGQFIHQPSAQHQQHGNYVSFWHFMQQPQEQEFTPEWTSPPQENEAPDVTPEWSWGQGNQAVDVIQTAEWNVQHQQPEVTNHMHPSSQTPQENEAPEEPPMEPPMESTRPDLGWSHDAWDGAVNGVGMGNDLTQLLLETRSESAVISDEFTGLGWDREVEREVFRPSFADEDGGAAIEGSTDDQVDKHVEEPPMVEEPSMVEEHVEEPQPPVVSLVTPEVPPIETKSEAPSSPPPSSKASHIRHFRHNSASSQTSNASSAVAPLFPTTKAEPASLSTSTSPKKRRQESLHKRFEEASAKSKLALERLQREKGLLSSSPAPPVQPTVNLWSVDSVSRTKPVLLMPASAANVQKTPTSSNLTPIVSPSLLPPKTAKAPLTSTPKDNTLPTGQLAGGGNEKLLTTAPRQPAPVNQSKRPGILMKNQSVDAEPSAPSKKAAEKTGKRVGAARRESAHGIEEDAEEKQAAQVEDDRRRPSSRGSVHSAYDGYPYYEDRRHMAPEEYGHRRDHDWYRSYYYKRRPYSRASDREDWRYFHRDERFRPRSTQSYAGERDREDEDEDKENDGEDEKSDNGSDEYDEEDERRELEYYDRRGGYMRHHNQHYRDYYRYQHAYHHYNQQQYHLGSFDPAWQRYIMEYYRYYGQYPTYDQLHRMWAEQQKRGQQPTKAQADQRKGGAEQQAAEGEQKSAAHDLPALQKGLLTLQYASGDESQPSLSRQGSERSFEIRSELSSSVSGAIFAKGAPAVTAKIREPPKHSVCHAICRFGAGGHLVLVTSTGGGANTRNASGGYSKAVEIRNVRSFVTDASWQGEMEKMEKFPGPLSSKDTSKLEVIQFCQKKLDEIGKPTSGDGLTDRESVALIWRFLLLLVRQNGVAMGNDLTQLLLETRSESAAISDEFTGLGWGREVEREVFRPSFADEDDDAAIEGSTDDQVDNDVYGEERDRRNHRQRHTKQHRSAYDRTLVNCSTQTSDFMEFQFRQLLLTGNKKEALEWAVKYRLWGHALFLAMKVDQRTHTSVMTRFANSLALNDPLQTLYQTLSGGVPYAVTRVPDEKWGDWRPHLAMILSNLTPVGTAGAGDPASVDVQLQQQQEFWSIFTMGKTLMRAGRPYAAHFCFLCCHVLAGWDIFSPSVIDGQEKRLVPLIGAYDEENDEELFTLERYQCTEVYEYAIGLRNQPLQSASCLPAIQTYKWIYLLRLAAFGYREEAYRYLQNLSSTIQAYPQYFTASFIKCLSELAGRLQQFDPTVETIGSSLRSWQQPAWIGELATLTTAPAPQAAVGNDLVQPALVTRPEPAAVPNEYSGYGSNREVERDVFRRSLTATSDESVGFGLGHEIDQNAFRTSIPDEGPIGNIVSVRSSMDDQVDNEQPGVFGSPGSDSVFGVSPVPPQIQPPQLQRHHSQVQQPTMERRYSAHGQQQLPSSNVLAPQMMQPPVGAVKSPPPPVGNKPTLDDKVERIPSWFECMVKTAIGKVRPKRPNEMILPDDKNKKIVWDADKQRWVNMDGDEDESSRLTAPPPSDFQLSATTDPPVITQTNPLSNGTNFLEQAYHNAHQQQPQQHAPSTSNDAPQPSLFNPSTIGQQQHQPSAVSKPSNAFRNRRNENRRYVDVFGGGSGGGVVNNAADVPFVPPWPPAEGGNVNVFTPEGNNY